MNRSSHVSFDPFRMLAAMLAGCVVVAACGTSTSVAGEPPVATTTAAAPDDSDGSGTPPEVAPRTSTDGEDSDLQLLAHRGVHQTFGRDGVDDQTCTATRIDRPTHDYLENTLRSMEAAFAAGATVVEIDIAPSSDGVLAVFHDWTVECRTEGSGEIRSHTWDELSKLDVGYGYTADGQTYPFRGQGVGLMPRLEDVFEAFPEAQFLINFKSDDPSEALLLQEVVEREDAAAQVWAVYGAPVAVQTYVSNTDTRGFSEASIRACLSEYVAANGGASALHACEDTVVVVPLDIAPLLTGWPNEFIATMSEHGSDVVIVGPGGTGIDTKADLDDLPKGLSIYVWTDQIEAIT